MNPWDRIRGNGDVEPARWFGRFDRFYRPMGTERSLLGAYNALRVSEEKSGNARSVPASWDDHSRRWNWKKRAEAWDAKVQREHIDAEDEARREMLRRQGRVAQLLQGLGAKKLREMAQEKELDLAAGEARRMIIDGAALERKVMGLPDHLLAVANMSDEQLIEQYQHLYSTVAPDDGDESGDGVAWLTIAAASDKSEGSS